MSRYDLTSFLAEGAQQSSVDGVALPVLYGPLHLLLFFCIPVTGTDECLTPLVLAPS